MFRQSILALVLLALMLPGGVFAQETPIEVREAAINALNGVFPTLGRPLRWEHSEAAANETNLGCSLLGAGQGLEVQVLVYVVSLYYDNATFVYHISADARNVVPCDEKLLNPSTFTPDTGGQACDANAKTFIKLQNRQQALVSVPQANVRQLADPTSTLVATIPQNTNVFLLSGPFCSGTYAYWFADYGGARGYILEVDFTTAESPAYALSLNPNPQANFATNASTGVTSATCPADFRGYAVPRLYVGATGQVEAGGSNNIIRQSYGRSSQHTGTEIPPEGTFSVIGGPECTGAELNEAIVWWQVSYNGTTGWTAESLNGAYFLQLFGAPVAAEPATSTLPNNAAAPPSSTSEVLPPQLPLPATRAPLTTSNFAQIWGIGEMQFPDSIRSVRVSPAGRVAVYISGMNLRNNVLFYNNLNGSQLSSNGEKILSGNEALFLDASAEQYAIMSIDPVSSQTSIGLHDAQSHALTSTLATLTGNLYELSFSPDGAFAAYFYDEILTSTSHLIVANLGFGTSKELTISSRLADVGFSRDGKFLAALQTDGTIRLWDGQTMDELKSIPTTITGFSNHLALSPTGNRVAIGGEAGKVEVWDTQAGTLLHSFEVYNQLALNGVVGAIAFSPDGNLLATGGYLLPLVDNAGNNVLVFDLQTGQQVATLGGMVQVFGLQFSPLGDFLIGHDEYVLSLWGIKP